MKVPIIEDDFNLNEILANFLRKEAIEAISAFNLSQAHELFDSDIKLVVLDLNLPDGHGFQFLKHLRQISDVPVIVLTALGDELTQLQVFNLEADEYVEKPVSPLVMTKRIQALLNRVYPKLEVATINGYRFDFIKYQVLDGDGKEISMTAKELNFLKYLIKKKGNPATREQIIEAVWGFEYREDIRLLDSHVKNIRKKLGPDLIKTVQNVGYKILMGDK